jgi:serine/threonine protein kinase
MNLCPRVPKEDMYMDLHYAAGPLKGGARRRQQRGGSGPSRAGAPNAFGGDASFKVLDYIVSLGLDKDAFEAACKAGWTVLANLGRGGFGSVDHIRVNMPTGPKEYVMKTLFVCPKAEHYARHEFDAHKYMIDTQTTEPTDLLIEYIIPAIALAETTTSAGKNYHIFFEKEEGRSLDQFISIKRRYGQTITLEHEGDITNSLNEALASIHRAGVIHRDIKPANIFLITDPAPNADPKYKIKLIDFGLAIGANVGAQHPGAGTPEYFSHEHKAVIRLYREARARGENTARLHYIYTPADDIYAMHLTFENIMAITDFAPPPHGPPQGPQPPGARGRLLSVTQSAAPVASSTLSTTLSSISPAHYMSLPAGPIGMAINPGVPGIAGLSSISSSSGVHGGKLRSVKKTDRRRNRKQKTRRHK